MSRFTKRTLGEARTFFFAPQPVNPSWLSPATPPALLVAGQEKPKTPSRYDGQNDPIPAGLLTPSQATELAQKSELAKAHHPRKVVNTRC